MSTPDSRVRLGRTELLVSPIGLGCWQFSGGRGIVGRFWPALDQGEVTAIVSAALAAGINWFDTAEGYGWGHSERSLTTALEALGPFDEAPLVATKWWPFPRLAAHMRKSIDERRAALGGRVIDLYQIHQRMSPSSLRAQMGALADLVDAGHVRAVGVSNFGARAMRRSAELLDRRGIPLAANQVRYNLLDRRIETNGVLEAARSIGATVIAYSPLAQGVLTGRFHDSGDSPARVPSGSRRRMPAFRASRLRSAEPVVRELREIGRRYGCTPAQASLAWLTQRLEPGLVVAIPGATSPTQAQQNAASMRIRLTPEEIRILDSVSDPDGSYRRAAARGREDAV